MYACSWHGSTYFGEDPSQMPAGELFKLFFQFVQDYRVRVNT